MFKQVGSITGILLLLCLMMTGCSRTTNEASPPKPMNCKKSKINFDIDAFDAHGLIGPTEGLRSVDYEFCIPDQKAHREAVLAIDSNLQFVQAPGRSDCRPGEILCLGTTNQHYRSVLCALSLRPFIRKINPTYWE